MTRITAGAQEGRCFALRPRISPFTIALYIHCTSFLALACCLYHTILKMVAGNACLDMAVAARGN
jgi:hypothetical protein